MQRRRSITRNSILKYFLSVHASTYSKYSNHATLILKTLQLRLRFFFFKLLNQSVTQSHAFMKKRSALVFSHSIQKRTGLMFVVSNSFFSWLTFFCQIGRTSKATALTYLQYILFSFCQWISGGITITTSFLCCFVSSST